MLIPASIAPFHRRGASSIVSNTTGGNVVMIAAGSNLNGLILRTINLMPAGASGYLALLIGGNAVFQSCNAVPLYYFGPGILVPAGLAIEQTGGAGGNVTMTWDFL